METLGNRIRRIRQDAHLSMDKFGEAIGVNSSSVARWENDQNAPAESKIKLICREFKVNYDWLVDGTGEMYSDLAQTVLDILIDEYRLNDTDRLIMERYLKLTPEQRAVIHSFVEGLIEDNAKKQGE